MKLVSGLSSRVAWFLSLLVSASAIAAGPEWIAHRGSWHNPPLNAESQFAANTIEAFDDALSQGFDGFEFDVMLTQDGQLAVSHDGDLSIATGCKGWLGNLPLATLQKKCRVGASQTHGLASVAAPRGARLPSLVDVLRHFARDRRARHFMIDVKPGETTALIHGLERAMRALTPAEAAAVSRKAIVYAPTDEALVELRRVLPGLAFARELDPIDQLPTELAGAGPSRMCKYNSVYVGANVEELRQRLDKIAAIVRDSNQRKQPVVAWNVDDRESFELVQRRLPGLGFVLTNARRASIPPR